MLVKVFFSFAQVLPLCQTASCQYPLVITSDIPRQASRSIQPPDDCITDVEYLSSKKRHIVYLRDPCFLKLLIVVLLLGLDQVSQKVSQLLLQLLLVSFCFE
jgi:hypothetical protein